MIEYPKIQSIFKRDEKTHKFIEGLWSLPEFEYLKNNLWLWTEKVDGTNVRIEWDVNPLENKLNFGGKTDNAQMSIFLFKRLQEIFTEGRFAMPYSDISMTLYGEGYGAKIQKGGGNYIPNGVDFVLFDVMINGYWLERKNIEDIALKLGIKVVPILNTGTLLDAINFTKEGFKSYWGDFIAEGMVLKPLVELKNKKSERVITKMKYKDFER